MSTAVITRAILRVPAGLPARPNW